MPEAMFRKVAGAWKQVHPHIAPYLNATGGAVTSYVQGGKLYRVHAFLTSGTFTVLQGSGGRKFEYLLVAGGAQGGSRHSGGGGGGGVLPGFAALPAGPHTIVVGAGGIGAVNNSHAGNNGQDSAAFGFVAKGGGGGAGYNDGANVPVGNDGGCGGGSGAAVGLPAGGTAIPGRGTPGQGFDGGIGSQTNGQWAAGGGGGARQAGANAAQPIGGKGGDGYPSSILDGTVRYYGGGGGGGGDGDVTANGGAGGLGGGGKGTGKYTASDAIPGTPNTGGGGGGVRDGTPVAGGSGVVYIRYEVAEVAPTLSGALGNAQVILTWTAATIPGQTVTGYEIDTSGVLSTVGNVLTATITGLTNGTPYTFRVRAITAAGGRGSWSDSVVVTPQPFNIATGGTAAPVDVVNYNGLTGQTWRVHTFTANGNFVISTAAAQFRVMRVGGGGGGGGGDNNTHGSGGSGGQGADDMRTIAAGTWPVVIGNGGGGNGWGYGGAAASGQPTTFAGLTANGGAGGADNSANYGATQGPNSNARNGVATVQYGVGGYPNTGEAGGVNTGAHGAANSGNGGGGASQYRGGGGSGGSGIVVIAYRIA